MVLQILFINVKSIDEEITITRLTKFFLKLYCKKPNNRVNLPIFWILLQFYFVFKVELLKMGKTRLNPENAQQNNNFILRDYPKKTSHSDFLNPPPLNKINSKNFVKIQGMPFFLVMFFMNDPCCNFSSLVYNSPDSISSTHKTHSQHRRSMT